MSKPITPRQEHFARLLVEGKMTQEQCYVAAGFKGGNGNASQLARRPAVREYIDRLRAKAERRAVADLAYVMDGLMAVAESSKRLVPHDVVDGKLVEKMADASAANRALELLGKTMGAFVDRTQVDLSESTRQYIDRLVGVVVSEVHDQETLRRIIERLEGEIGGGGAAG